MKATRLDKHGARRTGNAIHSELALFVTSLAFGLAMLSLFAVLAFANVMPLGEVAPFFPVSVLLFVASGVFFMSWSEGEAHEAAVEEARHLSSMHRPTAGRAGPELAERRQAREFAAGARR
jgi:hypothetical protein